MIATLVYVGVVVTLGGMFVELMHADGHGRAAPFAVMAATLVAAALVAVAMITAGSN